MGAALAECVSRLDMLQCRAAIALDVQTCINVWAFVTPINGSEHYNACTPAYESGGVVHDGYAGTQVADQSPTFLSVRAP
jgi:hypothetical protein